MLIATLPFTQNFKLSIYRNLLIHLIPSTRGQMQFINNANFISTDCTLFCDYQLMISVIKLQLPDLIMFLCNSPPLFRVPTLPFR